MYVQRKHIHTEKFRSK